jgi:hypothetical protein
LPEAGHARCTRHLLSQESQDINKSIASARRTEFKVDSISLPPKEEERIRSNRDNAGSLGRHVVAHFNRPRNIAGRPAGIFVFS